MDNNERLFSGIADLPVTHVVLDFIDKQLYRDEKPYAIAGPLPVEHEHRRTNIVTSSHDVPVRDVRGHEDALDIDANGFEILTRESIVPLNTVDDDSVSTYLADLSEWLLKRLAAKSCICYAFKFRSSERQNRSAGTYSGSRQVPDEPSPLAHVDHTKSGGPRRIRRHLTEKEAGVYFGDGERLRIVTMWRPINGIVEDYPLALCDPFSVNDAEDLIAGDRISPPHLGEVYYVAYDEAQRWYWLSGQKISEILVFNSFDSQRDIGPAFTPHGTFKIASDGMAKSRPRESLEARFIVIG